MAEITKVSLVCIVNYNEYAIWHFSNLAAEACKEND